MNFGNQKGGNRRVFGTIGREQKNFTDPCQKKINCQNINLY